MCISTHEKAVLKNNADVEKEEVRKPDFSKVKAEARAFVQSLSVSDFINPQKPWILVPNGSFMGFFDFVPPAFRKGPWGVVPSMFVALVIYGVLHGAVYNYSTQGLHALPNNYYEAWTIPWYLNLGGLLWTSYVYRDLFVSGIGLPALVTFTVQSYSYIWLRFFLSTMAPFVPSLGTANELLRYPILSQSTVTFIVWNFILFPVILFCIKDPVKRKAFLSYFTNFRLQQLHFFHMFLAAFSGIYGTPPRPLLWTDLYASLTLGLCYCLFYILVLDRLGMHFYMIFSPRTLLAIPSWSLVLASTIGLFSVWGKLIQTHGGYWEGIRISDAME